MKELKDIDRLFQEKFKDFEAHPPLEVWDKIAEKLDADKNKKRAIPWWYWTCGVAALFIIGFLGYNVFTNSRDLPALERQIPVANTTETELKTDKKDRLDIKDSDQQNGITFEPDNGGVDILQDVSDTQTNEKQQYPVTISPNSSGVNRGKQKTNALANSDKHSTQSKSKRKAENNLTAEESIADALQNGTLTNPQDFEKIIVENNSKSQGSTQKINEEEENDISPKESQIVEAAEMNELEKLLQDKLNEEDVAKSTDKPEQRWSLNTVIAPVGFGTSGSGSILDPSLAGNEKSYEMSVSYGVGMQYKVDKKLSIRTGINRVTLGYNTNDLDFMPNMNARRLQNVNHTPQGSTISVQTKGGVTSFVENPVSMPNGGYLNQRMGFVEIPTEVSYRLFGSKIGITLIGGISSLFLTENRIEAVAHSFQTNLGEANNINSVSFSSNIGVGFEYNFLKKFQAHIEPMFKYQFNTFRGDVGTVRPFFFGVYSGISYKF